MSNSLTKEVEFANNDSNRKVVFDGTYTAKKGDVKLNEFIVASTYTTTTDQVKLNALGANLPKNKVTFYVFVDGNEVADAKLACTKDTNNDVTACTAGDTFDNILVKAGESVKVKVEAEVETSNTSGLPIDL
jgi:hypothetical protein